VRTCQQAFQQAKERLIKLYHRQFSLPLLGNEQSLLEMQNVLEEFCEESDVQTFIRPEQLSQKLQASIAMRDARLTFEMFLHSPTDTQQGSSSTAGK
jgi:hypothetical protein